MKAEELFFENETRKHQQKVSNYLMLSSRRLLKLAIEHDLSKLQTPEREIFIEYTPKLKAVTYGSDKYKEYLQEMKKALDHHYANNMHHPEFYDKVDDMDLFCIIEMLIDWYAATERHEDGDIQKSITINEKRFGINPQLSQIFRNTILSIRMM